MDKVLLEIRKFLNAVLVIAVPLFFFGITALLISTGAAYWQLLVDFINGEFLSRPWYYVGLLSAWSLRLGATAIFVVMILRILLKIIEWSFQRFFTLKTNGG
ncbi:hypothetical protein A2962_02995 [Candidatus Woesebacteria bacterium RIFCSPLOWO2_01_FULL_39_61]|uniref:Uncharacterized protein n=1 Tax=Candidatus Woesebacteria bacterium RIFCSPHIGHO2_02_FULL_39_13 TaxID=1802505 RepID=A0A1F7Z0E0_9BACT|nr:MAG: hypothetical protein A2692_04125 [Candidatus Woesebacteria bacterium RIFCSPHIGHO2_01_FULL_39_95]OGM33021.1 MAG: hypothetical protein A3D01_04205 [Candidatus Woesebacteria bacterium RIFCSPHIGHO2_02_FULL_39_13]OGM37880.1 MAG: hypothetical protein A3E13_04100 [Candidatus Woesebacteria bacterium RIFCSPHIGHO2_12_FULL_40_20]OGM66453.1 MAG: hypothetical protein A2962_02995 [Candidatus Woesebacteria bacterium RIFCSPLOWO2_01_FULL_39_61]OGM74816.1 MAG: hypothetical protein A3H19_01765 [Candidatus